MCTRIKIRTNCDCPVLIPQSSCRDNKTLLRDKIALVKSRFKYLKIKSM